MGRTSGSPELRRTWGNWGAPRLVKCAGLRNDPCDRMIRAHPNGQRTRCTAHQLNSLASRQRAKRRKGRTNGCVDCGGPKPVKGKGKGQTVTRSPRCDACRLRHARASKNQSARERRAFARESRELT